jgi:hypothetical protein
VGGLIKQYLKECWMHQKMNTKSPLLRGATSAASTEKEAFSAYVQCCQQ